MQQQMVQPQQQMQQQQQQQQMQQQQRMQMQHPVSQMGNPQMIQQQGPMMSQQMQQQQHQLQQQRMQHEQLRQQQLQHMQQMQQQRMQHGGPGFEPPQQVVSLQNRMPMGPGGQFGPHMAGGPRPMGAMQQMMNQVSQPMIRQQMGMGGRMPGMPGHPAVTAGLRLNIPPQQMGSGAPGTPNSALPSPALTPRSEHDDMDTGSSRGPTPGSDKMDGSITPDLNDPNKLKRRPSQPQAGQKRRISANDGVGAKKRPRKGSRVDDGDYDNYIDTVMHQLKNLPPMSTVEPKLSHCFNACGVYGIGDVPKLMSKDIDIHKGPLEGKFGNSSLSTEGDYYSTMPFGPEPPVPYIPPVSCSQRGFYQQEFMQERRPEIPRMDGYISPDLFCSSSPEPNPEEERRKRKKRIEKRKVVRAREKAEALKEAEKKKAEQKAKEEQEKLESKEGENKDEKGEEDEKKDENVEKDVKAEKEDKEAAEPKKEPAEVVIKQEPTVSEETPTKDSKRDEEDKEKEKEEVDADDEEEDEEEEECISPWLDLEPDDSDDEPVATEPPPPPEISSRPASPETNMIKPIPIKPKPGQT